MNVLFLNSIEKETYGGMEEWVRLAAVGLAQRQHNVTIAGRRGSEYLRRVAATSEAVRLLPLDISGDFNPLTIATLRKFFAANNIEIVVVNFNKDVRLGGLAARWEGKPRVVWSVGLDITKDNPIHRFLTPRLIDGVIVPSHALKKQITRSRYVEESLVDVIPIGIADRGYTRPTKEAVAAVREKFAIPEDTVVAVTVGRFVEQKGHRCLIDAARRITAAFPRVVFLLLGDGPLRGELEAMIARFGLERHFLLAGMREDVDAILAGADMMIHPSIEEPFGIALLEGMRAGLPIVASRVGGIPEVVREEETAVLVEPRQSEAIAEAVIRLLEDPSLRETLGAAGHRRWREEFRIDVMVDRVERYLTNMLARMKQYG